MDISHLHINVGGQPSPPYLGSDAALDVLAAAAGGPLPASYVAFLRQADGGHPEFGAFLPDGAASGEWSDVDWFYGVANPAVEYVGEVLAAWRATLGRGALPIGRDGGGNQLFLQLDQPSAPVWLWMHDPEGRRKVADDFAAFVAALQQNPDLI